MDRFIGFRQTSMNAFPTFKIQYGQIYSQTCNRLNPDLQRLKSNMDRFIEFTKNTTVIVLIGLKSNMDRFIAFAFAENITMKHMFKIQYGQIYRFQQNLRNFNFLCLKSNMDRFIDEQ